MITLPTEIERVQKGLAAAILTAKKIAVLLPQHTKTVRDFAASAEIEHKNLGALVLLLNEINEFSVKHFPDALHLLESSLQGKLTSPVALTVLDEAKSKRAEINLETCKDLPIKTKWFYAVYCVYYLASLMQDASDTMKGGYVHCDMKESESAFRYAQRLDIPVRERITAAKDAVIRTKIAIAAFEKAKKEVGASSHVVVALPPELVAPPAEPLSEDEVAIQEARQRKAEQEDRIAANVKKQRFEAHAAVEARKANKRKGGKKHHAMQSA